MDVDQRFMFLGYNWLCPCFQGYIRFVSLLLPLICPHKVIHNYLSFCFVTEYNCCFIAFEQCVTRRRESSWNHFRQNILYVFQRKREESCCNSCSSSILFDSRGACLLDVHTIMVACLFTGLPSLCRLVAG